MMIFEARVQIRERERHGAVACFFILRTVRSARWRWFGDGGVKCPLIPRPPLDGRGGVGCHFREGLRIDIEVPDSWVRGDGNS